jgi:hypothetical protein
MTNAHYSSFVVRRWSFVFFVGLLWSLLASCATAPPVVKIGLVGPFEGRHRAVGYDVIYSARLAVREINAAGGIGGYRLALVALDDGGDPELAAQIAASLVLDEAVVAVIGHWLPETTAAAAPIYQAAGLHFIAGGQYPYELADPAHLSPAFREAYAAVTPFDETAGPYAGPAYAAMQAIFADMETAVQANVPLSRAALFPIR